MMIEILDTFLADFGVTVTDGTTTATGILDMPSEVIAGGMVITTDFSLTVRSDAFPNLKYDDPLTVNGIAYTVREVKLQDDGKFSIVYLSRV